MDRIVCLGDVATLGPRPVETVARLRELSCPCIQGNHDEFLTDVDAVHGYTEVPLITRAIEWARSELSSSDLAFLAGFRKTLEIPLGGDAMLLLFHGSPLSHMDDLLATTPCDELDRLLGGCEAAVMAGGHTHIQMVRQHRGNLLVNPGSVGAPFREFVGGRLPTLLPHAEYAVVEGSEGGVRVDLRRVALDKGALRRAAAEREHPMRDSLVEQYV